MDRAGLAKLGAWVAHWDDQLVAQTAWRDQVPAHYSTGALDPKLADIRQLLERRRWSFRNLSRMNQLLDLVRLHGNRLDDPAAWAQLIRAQLGAAPRPNGSRTCTLRKHPVPPRAGPQPRAQRRRGGPGRAASRRSAPGAGCSACGGQAPRLRRLGAAYLLEVHLPVLVDGHDAHPGPGALGASAQHSVGLDPFGMHGLDEQRPVQAVVVLAVEVGSHVELRVRPLFGRLVVGTSHKTARAPHHEGHQPGLVLVVLVHHVVVG